VLGGDRGEFERQVSILCAGFGGPVGDRAEAYWKAFAKFELIEFTRLVEHALQEGEFERVPTPAQLRQLRKRARLQSARAAPGGRNAALVEYVLADRKLSEPQKLAVWNWIARATPEPTKEDPLRRAFEFLGVIVPQDPQQPEIYPAQRVLFANVDWQPFLEDTHAPRAHAA